MSGPLAGVIDSRIAGAVGFATFVASRLLPSVVQIALFTLVWAWGSVQVLDRFLGFLAGWGISKTPKALQWKIGKIKVRPSLAFWSADSWSEVVICDWTWHNPPWFKCDLEDSANSIAGERGKSVQEPYLLRIEQMTLRLELGSIFAAVRRVGAVKIDLLLLEGLHFWTQRNESSLNLWEALDLPDEDVNVSAIVRHAQRHGGLGSAEDGTLKGIGGREISESPRSMRGAVSFAASEAAPRRSTPRGRRGLGAARAVASATVRAMRVPVAAAQKLRGWWAKRRQRRADGGAGAVVGTARARFLQGVRPLPAIATLATRRAAKYWNPAWGSARRRLSFYQKLEPTPGCCLAGLARWATLFRRRRPRQLQFEPEGSFAEKARETMSSSSTASWPPPPLGAMDGDSFGDEDGEGDCAEAGGARQPQYTEYPIGHPMRRPHWGVPLRFDIRQIVALRLQLDILALLTISAHKSLSEHTVDSKMEIKTLLVSRQSLEADDERRNGTADGVRGVYLGELVWVLIAKAVPIILRKSPSRLLKNALLAATYALKDTAVRVGAGALELALNAEHTIAHSINEVSEVADAAAQSLWDGFLGDDDTIEQVVRLQVHLVSGRRMTWRGHPANVRALLSLKRPRSTLPKGEAALMRAISLSALSASDEEVVDSAQSAVRVWTTTPRWDEYFQLGPVRTTQSTLSVACYHHKDTVMTDALSDIGHDVSRGFIGEVLLPLDALLIADEVIRETDEIVGWFPLFVDDATPCCSTRTDGSRYSSASGAESPKSGGAARASDRSHRAELKLGLRLVSKEVRRSRAAPRGRLHA